jgi:hypothetical protein
MFCGNVLIVVRVAHVYDFIRNDQLPRSVGHFFPLSQIDLTAYGVRDGCIINRHIWRAHVIELRAPRKRPD